MSGNDVTRAVGTAAEGIRQTLMGRARENAGRLQQNTELERQGRDQAARGQQLCEQAELEVTSEREDAHVGR